MVLYIGSDCLKNSHHLNQKFFILVPAVLIALGSYFLAMQFSTSVEQNTGLEASVSKTEKPVLKTQDSSKQLESVDILLVGLKKRLETHSNDVDGWILLSKSYYHLNRLDEAEEAFEKAKSLGYTGNWKPLPRIDSFMQNDHSAKKLKELASFRNKKNVESDSYQ